MKTCIRPSKAKAANRAHRLEDLEQARWVEEWLRADMAGHLAPGTKPHEVTLPRSMRDRVLRRWEKRHPVEPQECPF